MQIDKSYMVNYTFILKVVNTLQQYKYTLNLTLQQENNPNLVFNSKIRESMRNNLQMQSNCKINEFHLNQIITTWIQDIKEGYRDSTLTLDLPLLIVENFKTLQEKGNHEMPKIITPQLSNVEPSFGMLPPLIFS